MGAGQKGQGTNMGAGSPWPTCGTYTDDWLVTLQLSFESVLNDATWHSENLDCVLSPQAYLH